MSTTATPYADGENLSEPEATTADGCSPVMVGDVDDALASELIRELAAVQKELHLYPEGHPRLEERLDRLDAIFKSRITSDRPLVFSVEEQSSGSQRVLQLSLRERGVRQLVFRKALSRADIGELVRFFLSEPGTDEPRTILEELPDLGVDWFEERLDATSEEALADRWDPAHLAESASLQNLAPEYRGIVLNVVDRPAVRERLSELEKVADESRQVDHFDHGIPFLGHFFDMLAEHSPGVWEEPEAVERLLVVATDSLYETIQSRGKRSAAEDAEVEGGPDTDQWVDGLYWRALRQLFPGDLYSRGARDGEVDSDYEAEPGSSDAWTVEKPLDENWGATHPDELKGAFRPEQLDGIDQLLEYLHVCEALDSQEESDQSRKSFGAILGAALEAEPTQVGDTLVTLSADPGWQRLEVAYWLEPNRLRALTPDTIVQVLRSTSDWDEVLNNPPALVGPIDKGAARCVVADLIRSRDSHSLAVLLRILREFENYSDNPWCSILETYPKVDRLTRIVSVEAAQTVLHSTGVGLIPWFPTEGVVALAKAFWRQASEDEALRVVYAMGKVVHPTAIRCLESGLEVPSSNLRLAIIAQLGEQEVGSPALTFERLLRQQNTGSYDIREIYQICNFLARRTDEDSMELAQRIGIERKSWGRFRWRREIRNAIREVARQKGSGS